MQTSTRYQRRLPDTGTTFLAEPAWRPIFEHRFVVCGPDPESSVVLSIVTNDVDAIVYGRSLEDYLVREFLEDHTASAKRVASKLSSILQKPRPRRRR